MVSSSVRFMLFRGVFDILIDPFVMWLHYSINRIRSSGEVEVNPQPPWFEYFLKTFDNIDDSVMPSVIVVREKNLVHATVFEK